MKLGSNHWKQLEIDFWKCAGHFCHIWSDLVWLYLRTNINNILRAFLPFISEFFSTIFSFSSEFSFSSYFVRPISRSLSSLIVSLPLYSSYSYTCSATSAVFTDILYFASSHTFALSVRVIYIFFAFYGAVMSRHVTLHATHCPSVIVFELVK